LKKCILSKIRSDEEQKYGRLLKPIAADFISQKELGI